MLVALEQARSMALYAALMLDEPDDAERAERLSAVKVQVGRRRASSASRRFSCTAASA
jgi:hypothetical protein